MVTQRDILLKIKFFETTVESSRHSNSNNNCATTNSSSILFEKIDYFKIPHSLQAFATIAYIFLSDLSSDSDIDDFNSVFLDLLAQPVFYKLFLDGSVGKKFLLNYRVMERYKKMQMKELYLKLFSLQFIKK